MNSLMHLFRPFSASRANAGNEALFFALVLAPAVIRASIISTSPLPIAIMTRGSPSSFSTSGLTPSSSN